MLRGLGAARACPSPTTPRQGSQGHQAPPGNGDKAMPGQDVGAWAGLALGDPQQGMAGLWGAGHWPCCSIAGRGADSPGAAPGQSGGAPGGQAGLWYQQAHPTMAVLFLLNLHASACLSFQPFILSTEKNPFHLKCHLCCWLSPAT